MTRIDCAGCRAHCCRAELVALTQEDDRALYPEAFELDADGKHHLRQLLPSSIGWALPHGDDGACVYLKENRCSIYEKRPQMCREFSCVGWVARIMETTTRAERRRDKALIDTAVWREGKKRGEAA